MTFKKSERYDFVYRKYLEFKDFKVHSLQIQVTKDDVITFKNLLFLAS